MEDEVNIKLRGFDGAIVATEESIQLIVPDEFVQDGDGPPHLAKLCIAMLFIDALKHRADWYEYSLKIIESIANKPHKG